VPPVMPATLVSLLVVGAGWCALLRCGSETVVVPAEGGCFVISGGGSAVLAAVPRCRAGISSAGAGVSGTEVGVSVAEGRVPNAGAKVVSALSDATCLLRSSISCLSDALLGVGATLATAGWGVTSEMHSG
jgi:hypothetical protein